MAGMIIGLQGACQSYTKPYFQSPKLGLVGHTFNSMVELWKQEDKKLKIIFICIVSSSPTLTA